jgi:alpha-tubulin suppressor-like RCC1 family protein
MPRDNRWSSLTPIRAFCPVLVATVMSSLTACQKDVTSPSGPEISSDITAASTGGLIVSMVTIGSAHSCGLTLEGRAYCWGDNFFGQLGDGTKTDRLRPVAVAGGLLFSSVSAGDGYTCGLTTRQKAYCWGWNDKGMLGDGTTTDRLTPVPVKGGLLFRQIRPGARHTCGATTASVGYCWGSNGFGRLGDGSTVAQRLVPTRVAGSIKFLRVIAGGNHSCGLSTANKAFCWGYGREGQIGDGKPYLRYTPRGVAGGLAFKQVVPGYAHTCGVTTDDRAYCWGLNDQGQLGTGTGVTQSLVPAAVAGGHRFSGVSAASSHTCGVTTQQELWCWGWNLYGQLNVDPFFFTKIPSPILVPGTFSRVAGGLGGLHTCAVTSGGAAYCWGGNFDGQLGDGTTTRHSNPTPVLPPN